jgi:elongation factor Ts
MAEITAQQVKELREKTGAGMMDCKKALAETGGDAEKATDWLRAKGALKAASKTTRAATEGAVESYIHMGGKIGVLVEVNSETDFAAKNEKFRQLVKDVAMHIAASAPLYVRREDVDAAHLEREKAVALAEIKEPKEGKKSPPEERWPQIIEGKLEKFYEQVCLLEQPFVKDPEGKKKVKDVVTEAVATIGENIQVRRFARFLLGEGLEKKQTDFAAEVAAAAGVKTS